MDKHLGFICAPELPEYMTNRLIDELATYCEEQVDSDYNWKLDLITDPLTGAAETADEIIDEANHISNKQNWDYTICVTDLPLFDNDDVVLADVNIKKGIAQLSIPALGAPPMQKRTKQLIQKLIHELHEQENKHKEVKKTATHRYKRKFNLSPIRRIEKTLSNDLSIIRYLVIPKINGRLRTLLGMTYANRPWAVIASFKPIIAVAFATGAYSLIFPTLWELSLSYNLFRLIGMTFASIASMVIWMIVSHQLWEKRTQKGGKRFKRLYNATTLSTLSIAVIAYYLVLFVIFSTAIILFVPPDLFESLTDVDKEIDFAAFLRLSWLATSVATLAGSVGASSESDELVRNIAYGYRQNRRYQEIEQQDVESE
ncbi:hypothetical protein SAMN05421734_10342 [Pelagirhabdus alkalitolerans]|uniref:5,10-methylene-tetrahydrofolate dehydrogenase n=1 Tax=Pelagirhabdus alkalitolerans TaxID=1612202 RepID=A0A1G6HJC7_9BACI|nr:ABC transporter permease [Pelagirhabdus alkalitolerans]SDB94208.1 hypothetical protein SAMN05421734_10342 [Pelagirhabdus alkalitolerans]